jgi:RNA polymerase sigma-70 factor (ECF subfamily)
MIRGEVGRASVSEIEMLYRSGYSQFVRVATAILRDEERAVEAVQDGFAAALRDRSRFRGDGPLEAWVWRIVVNCARRARAGSDRFELRDADQAAESEELADAHVREAIARLPERQRLVLFLRYYADLDYASIATAAGIRPGTVAATLHAAHATLRNSLQEVRQ